MNSSISESTSAMIVEEQPEENVEALIVGTDLGSSAAVDDYNDDNTGAEETNKYSPSRWRFRFRRGQ